MANLKKIYNEKHKAQIQKDLGLKNVMQVPHLDKIVINMGLGEALQNGKLIDAGVEQTRGDPRQESYFEFQVARRGADWCSCDFARQPYVRIF
jgi:hypothetical protein